MNDYISKPVQLDAFAAVLARGLSRKTETTPLNQRQVSAADRAEEKDENLFPYATNPNIGH
jgi:DNA-binding response OmpR family regulator